MVEIATERCRVRTDSIRIVLGDIGDLDRVVGCDGPFDLVLSDFGALNCVDDLGSVLAAVARRLAPDGTVIAVIMGRFVPWEWAWMALSGRPRTAFRRLRAGGVDWRGTRIRYHSVAAIRRAARSAGLAFRRGFDVEVQTLAAGKGKPVVLFRRAAGLGVLLPTTEAGPWIGRHPRLMGVLDRLERRFETVPPLPQLADHVVVELGFR